MERSEDYMAKHFSEVKRELEQPDGHMAGIGQQLKLSEEARDARNAGRRLEDENDETDLIGTMKKLEDLIAEQRRSSQLDRAVALAGRGVCCPVNNGDFRPRISFSNEIPIRWRFGEIAGRFSCPPNTSDVAAEI